MKRAVLLALIGLAGLPVREGLGAGKDENLATFFMGRIKYANDNGNDCSDVGVDLMKLVSQASTIRVQEERRLKLTDPQIFETPFLFMNGHDEVVFTRGPNWRYLREYLSHGRFRVWLGLLYQRRFSQGYSWRREFARIFANARSNRSRTITSSTVRFTNSIACAPTTATATSIWKACSTRTTSWR